MTDLETIKKKLTVWKTITVGNGEYNSADEVHAAIKKGNLIRTHIDTNSWYEYSMGAGMGEIPILKEMILISDNPREVKLVKVSAQDIGFGDQTYGYMGGANNKRIMERIKDLGLKPCPVEVPWRLALECTDWEKMSDEDFGVDQFTEGFGNLVFFTQPLPFRDSLLVLSKEYDYRLKNRNSQFLFKYCLYGGVPIFHFHNNEGFIFETP